MTKRLVWLLLLGTACGGEAPQHGHEAPPARVENPVAESELPIVRLSPDAMRRLQIETATVALAQVRDVRLVGGEVVVPPGRTIQVAAPVGGMLRAIEGAPPMSPGMSVRRGQDLLRLVPLAPVDRDVRARADREVAAANAQLEAAEARVARVGQLVAERAGSQRTYEEAVAARDVARADVAVAEARSRTTRGAPLLADVSMTVRAPDDGIVRTLSAVADQAVAAGAPLMEIVSVSALQVRVPVYSGDVARVDVGLAAGVRPLAGASAGVEATPAVGPPTSDPARATIDRYYDLPPATFVPGERVLVELPLRTESTERTVPAASIVYDAGGAAWVYACAGDNAFARRRIDPMRRSGDLVVFERGPEQGACVASVGAAEIFGSEFEPGH